MYHKKLICIKKNSIQRGFFKKSTVLLIFIFLYFSCILTSDFKPKGFLITLPISRCCICPDGVVSNALLLWLAFLWFEPATELFFYFYMHMYICTWYIQVRFALRKSISLPPPPTILWKLLFFSFKNWKAFTNTKLGAKWSKLVKNPLISNPM